MAHTHDIIELDVGWARVVKEGIEPFIRQVEENETKVQFFKIETYTLIYDLVFKMCTQREPHNWSEQVYARYRDTVRDYCLKRAIPALTDAKEKSDRTFLQTWTERWHKQQLFTKGMVNLHTYLDRFFTVSEKEKKDGVYPLAETSYRIFKEHVFDVFRRHAAETVLSAIQKERDGEVQDRHLLHEACSVFMDMGFTLPDVKLTVYTQDLQVPLLKHAADYYRRMSRSWIDQDSCPNYLEKAEGCLDAERQRVESYLNQTSMEPLLSTVYAELLHAHESDLINKGTGVNHMLEADRRDDLARLFRLYSRQPDDLHPIANLTQTHIASVGISVVDKAQKGQSAGADTDHELVRNMLDLHERYNGVVKSAFQNHLVFQKALKLAFEEFINKDNRVSKLLAKFVNDVLKKGTKIASKDIDSTLDNVVFLYGYITEKDVFERDYQIFLANRLLMGLCESEHSEKSMIAKLKTEAGYQWTNKLEGMFKDVQLSKDMMQKFKRFWDAEKEVGLTLDVSVCNKGVWPATGSVVLANMPEDLVVPTDKFKRFYLNDHSGRRIDWRFDQGKAEVQVFFSKGVKRNLILTPYQMLIMLVFNDRKIATLSEILDITGIPRIEMGNQLLSLAHPKVGVLLKNPNNKDLEDDHKFMINAKFTSKLIKVQVPIFATTARPDEAKEEDQAIQLQRRHQTDAAVVRCMKIRKTMAHANLVAEVIQQLSARFKPKPMDIKKRIEALIEMEYLERDAEKRSTYNYRA